METEQAAGASERRGVPIYAVEVAVAALLLLAGLVVVYESYELGAGWTTDGPGAGYFPFYIGVILCISSLGTLYEALLGKNKHNMEIFVDSEQLRRVLVVLIPAIFYVALIYFIGIYIASAIYIAGFMNLLGKFSRTKSITAAVVISVLLFCMFEIWFRVPLVKGMLDPLSFLGY
jgi:hypothetical protein